MTLGQRSLQVVLAHPVPGVGRHAGDPVAVGRCRADRKYEWKILNELCTHCTLCNPKIFSKKFVIKMLKCTKIVPSPLPHGENVLL